MSNKVLCHWEPVRTNNPPMLGKQLHYCHHKIYMYISELGSNVWQAFIQIKIVPEIKYAGCTWLLVHTCILSPRTLSCGGGLELLVNVPDTALEGSEVTATKETAKHNNRNVWFKWKGKVWLYKNNAMHFRRPKYMYIGTPSWLSRYLDTKQKKPVLPTITSTHL